MDYDHLVLTRFFFQIHLENRWPIFKGDLDNSWTIIQDKCNEEPMKMRPLLRTDRSSFFLLNQHVPETKS